MRRTMQGDEMGEIKKGPWKPEEDQVLINHVNKYGARDWSSIRSKGLLCRTGKSCRLRWVNKLRPDLKTGVKFSAEEERMVIDLQAQFGNKWARIATYLPGRTDNDVKNFWSSRKKRLARIVHASEPSSSSAKLHKTNPVREPVPVRASRDIPSLEVPKYSSSLDEESPPMPTPLQSFPASEIDFHNTATMVPYLEMAYPGTLGYDHCPLQFDYLSIEREQEQFPGSSSYLCFPQTPQLQLDFPPLTDSQDFINRFGEPSLLDEFEQASGARGISMAPASIFVPDTNCQTAGREDIQDAMDVNSFIEDFPPIDIFDDIDRLPTPSHWS